MWKTWLSSHKDSALLSRFGFSRLARKHLNSVLFSVGSAQLQPQAAPQKGRGGKICSLSSSIPLPSNICLCFQLNLPESPLLVAGGAQGTQTHLCCWDCNSHGDLGSEIPAASQTAPLALKSSGITVEREIPPAPTVL